MPCRPLRCCCSILVDTYNAFRDDCFKATYLPYPEAQRVFAEAETRRRPHLIQRHSASPHLLPALRKVQWSQTRLDRKIAALRVIEALRMHAAAHDGALPDKLSEVTIVLIPTDPGTGEPFEYQRHATAPR